MNELRNFMFDSPGPRTYLSKQRMQSTAALANTSTLSVPRKTLKTSRTAATCLSRASVTSSIVVYWILTDLSAPKIGFHPDLMLLVHASTNSHNEHTI